MEQGQGIRDGIVSSPILYLILLFPTTTCLTGFYGQRMKAKHPWRWALIIGAAITFALMAISSRN